MDAPAGREVITIFPISDAVRTISSTVGGNGPGTYPAARLCSTAYQTLVAISTFCCSEPGNLSKAPRRDAAAITSDAAAASASERVRDFWRRVACTRAGDSGPLKSAV